jgi:ribosomal protein L7/L12
MFSLFSTDQALLLAVVIFSSLALLSSLSSSPRNAEAGKRLIRIEQKLDLILEHLSIDASKIGHMTELSEEVRKLADAGQKIFAIKLLQEETGWGLKQAKDAVEEYMG